MEDRPASSEDFMRMALALAVRAVPRAGPNPFVGCVVVKDSRVIGEGWHRRVGEPHAEVVALESCKEDPAGATVYVNLEPCAHHGRTPPCVAKLITSRVATVVTAMKDPDPRVNGRGMEALDKAGVRVVSGVLETESRRLNEAYCKARETGMPFVTAKVASSLDGRITTSGERSQWITSRASRELVHFLRGMHDAILTGAGTVREDNCRLTARVSPPRGTKLPDRIWPWERPESRNPLRVVLDERLELAPDRAIFETSDASTLVVTTDEAPREGVQPLLDRGVEIMTTPADAGGRIDLAAFMEALCSRGVNSLMVECGPTLLTELIRARLIDRLILVLAPRLFSSADAPGFLGELGVKDLESAPRLTSLDAFPWGDDVWVVGEMENG